MKSGRAWTEDYYDALTHYAWAPDELDHLSNPRRADRGRSSPYETVERLRRLEVPFNHLLAFFFSLAPSRFVVELFELYCGIEASGDVAYLGRNFERQLQIDLITQLDFAFENERVFLTIETKIDFEIIDRTDAEIRVPSFTHTGAQTGASARTSVFDPLQYRIAVS